MILIYSHLVLASSLPCFPSSIHKSPYKHSYTPGWVWFGGREAGILPCAVLYVLYWMKGEAYDKDIAMTVFESSCLFLLGRKCEGNVTSITLCLKADNN